MTRYFLYSILKVGSQPQGKNCGLPVRGTTGQRSKKVKTHLLEGYDQCNNCGYKIGRGQTVNDDTPSGLICKKCCLELGLEPMERALYEGDEEPRPKKTKKEEALKIKKSFGNQMANLLSCATHFRGKFFVYYTGASEKTYALPNPFMGPDRYWGLQPEFGFKTYETREEAEAETGRAAKRWPERKPYIVVDAETDIKTNTLYLPDFPELNGKTVGELEALLPELYHETH